MINMNILVTTVGGLTSPDILKAIKNNNEFDFYIIGIDEFEYAVGRKFVDKFFVSPSSANNENQFIDFINEIVKECKIDLIYPCGNEDNLILAKNIEKINTKVIIDSYTKLINAYDKGKVYELLNSKYKEHAPRFEYVKRYKDFFKAIKELGFPKNKVVVKPRFGIGGRGVYILSEYKSFDVFKNKPTNEFPIEFFENILDKNTEFDELIVMEYLDEIFYSAYSLCENGKNLITLTHIREWGNASQTFRGKVYYDENIENICSKIIKEFGLSYSINMELATSSDGRIVLFDLNPRIGASSGIDRDIGFNFPVEAIKISLGKPVSINKQNFLEPKIFVRYFDQVWI